MDSIELSSHAKINLRLDVLRKRADGYHDISTVLQKISLRDELRIAISKRDIKVICDNHQVPINEGNLAYTAAKAILNRYEIKGGVSISIKKNIPVAAGLGGGSSNAASTLAGINQLFGLGISKQELMKTGRDIGADVPFFIFGETALATGIGNRLEKIEMIPKLWLLLITPDIQVSTAWAYESLRMGLTSKPININIPNYINDLNEIITILSNDLEKVVIPRYPIIQRIKEELINKGAKGSLMSGSGSTVYGIFSSKDEAKEAYARLMTHNDWHVQLSQNI
jgi:4-diphosphocytidyl-2-C-methyl-D-erythritol kinase